MCTPQSLPSTSRRQMVIAPTPCTHVAARSKRNDKCPCGTAEWTTAFHAGDRETLRECYEHFFNVVWGAVGSVLDGADQESVVHEVFMHVLFDSEKRRRFRGGAFGAWLATVARNQAIDFSRRAMWERPCGDRLLDVEDIAMQTLENDLDFARLVRDLRENQLPIAWRSIFDARFIRQMSQREAACILGIHRTTLAYRESRIRRLLRRIIARRGTGLATARQSL